MRCSQEEFCNTIIKSKKCPYSDISNCPRHYYLASIRNQEPAVSPENQKPPISPEEIFRESDFTFPRSWVSLEGRAHMVTSRTSCISSRDRP